MKIGILTLPQETNYGGILQAFALQRTLRNMGHDAITIDRHNRRQYPSLKIHVVGYCKRLFLHYLKGKANVSTKWNPFITEEEYKASSMETQKFIERNIQLTRRVYSDELAEIDKEYLFDAYIVGSDQVWLDKYCPSSFLDFVKRHNVKKISYAASCGKNSFFNNTTKVKVCRELVKSFNGLSVREESLLQPCREKLGVEAQWVLDPTMLLTPADYLAATECRVDHSPILFSYILDCSAEKNVAVEAVASSMRLPVVNGNRVSGGTDKVFPSVDDWIQNFYRANFVITDSFHGTVFAILFNKPFITIGNAHRGIARFQSILSLFHLEDRIVLNVDASEILKIADRTIDFETVNQILEQEREESLVFIEKSLEL